MLHIPSCYHESMVNEGFVPMCSCSSCKGRRTHEGDFIDDDGNIDNYFKPKKRKIDNLTNINISNNNNQSNVICSNNESSYVEMNSSVLTGIKCPFDGSISRNNRNLPFISIGYYRKIMICSKRDVNVQDEQKRRQVANLIDEEAKKIKNSKNEQPIDASAPEEYKDMTDSLECIKKCSGYTQLKKTKNNEDHCDKGCNKLIYIKQNNTCFYFCCGAHALFYWSRSITTGRRSITNNNVNENNESQNEINLSQNSSMY